MDNGECKFALIDFGLAVHSRSWSREWSSATVAGDPRYWAPPHWMIVSHGHKYLEMHPDQSWRQQYEERVDHFAMGVMLLEMYFALWDGTAESDVKDHLADARSAWRAYWTSACNFFQELHTKGHASLRQRFARSEDNLGHHIESLRVLVVKLQAASVAASDSPVSSVFAIASELLSAQGTLSWGQIPALIDAGVTSSREASSSRSRLSSHRRMWSLGIASSLASVTSPLEGDTPPATPAPEHPRRFSHWRQMSELARMPSS